MLIRIAKFAVVFAALLAPAGAYAEMDNPGNSYQNCPIGMHGESFPNGNGFRCVPNHWE